MMRTVPVAVPIAVALTLVACGRQPDQPTDAATPVAAATPSGDPCRFMTAAEMAAITTDAVSELIREDTSCTYRSKPNDGVRVVVSIGDADAQMATARRAAGVLSGIGGAVADKGGAGADVGALLGKAGATADTIGDEAIWGPASILYARQGNAYVEVYPPNIHDPATHDGYPAVMTAEKRAIATAVAKRILAKAAG